MVENQANNSNQQFAEWLIEQINNFSENEFVIDSYFSQGLVIYMFDRVLGKYKNIDAVFLNDEGVGKNIQQALSVISNRLKYGVENKYFWEGLLQLIENSGYADDIHYGFTKVQDLIDQFPSDQTEKFLGGIFVGIENLIPSENDTEPKFDSLVSLTPEANKLALLICHRKDESLDNDSLNNLRNTISNLVLVEQIQGEMIEFIEQFIHEFGREDSDVFISGAIQALEKDNGVNLPLLDMLVRVNEFLNNDSRTSIVKKIDSLISSNTPEQIEEAIKIVEKVGSLKSYQEGLSTYSENWLSHFGPDVIPLFRNKIKLYTLLIKFNLMEADRFIEISIPHFPFAGNPEQLSSLMEGFENIKEGISESAGAQITQSIVAHINQFGLATLKAIKLAINWINLVEEGVRTNYNSVILSRIPRGLLRGFCALAKSVPVGAKFRNTPSACGGDRNFEDFASLLLGNSVMHQVNIFQF
jgi:hypothetical protein